MSTHIAAELGQIAPRVLLPGDPLRARWIAETFLDGASCYSDRRNMLGFTGSYRGTPISVQGTGMGQPSLAIYATELLREYGARQLVRVGTCGALDERLSLRDVVLAISASSDSAMNTIQFPGLHYSPTADFDLLTAAKAAADARGQDVTVGQLFSSDSFYAGPEHPLDRVAAYGVVAVEMECHALYTIAAGHGARALTVCTVSDHIRTGASASAADREHAFAPMVEIAIDAMLAVPLDDQPPASSSSS